jgi:glycine betaine/proline transport system ATP-binding protein
MTPAAALRRNNDEVFLDRNGRIRLRLDGDDKPVGVTLDGAAGTLAQADAATGETSGDGVDVIVASIDLKMRSAIALRRASGNPIVLVDQLGRMAGLCGDDEIYRALLQQRRAGA